jgi:hypothetical protein
MAELGLPDFETDTWSAIFAVKDAARDHRAPQPCRARGRARRGIGAARQSNWRRIRRSSPEELAAFRDRQLTYWAPIVCASGARIE